MVWKKSIKVCIILFFSVLVSCTSPKNISSGVKDGLSFETAIQVGSVSEEYDYIRSVCGDCTMINQSLSFANDKPYDVINMRTADGDVVSYYFDISSFFGRFK